MFLIFFCLSIPKLIKPIFFNTQVTLQMVADILSKEQYSFFGNEELIQLVNM